MLLPILDDGQQVFAPVPEGIGQNRAEAFDQGGLMARETIIRWLSDYLRRLCLQDASSSIVFQDIWAKPTDIAARQSISTKLLTSSEVYYIIQAERFHSQLFNGVVRDLTSFLIVGVFSRFRVNVSELGAGNFAGENVIAALARETQQIFVGAYDQEGIVVWRR
jgi:hypothetical protein